jgi:hypothetical protein
MAKKTLRFETLEQTLDKETGELNTLRKVSQYKVEAEPPYVKLYVKDLIRIKGLPPATTNVLLAMLRSMGYNNVIPAYAPIKKMMCRDLNIKIDTLNKAIDNLYKENILIRLDRGLYMADPELFGRGTWKEVENIRMQITYSPEGKKIISSSLNGDDQLKLNL